jgi:hypothetical protein
VLVGVDSVLGFSVRQSHRFRIALEQIDHRRASELKRRLVNALLECNQAVAATTLTKWNKEFEAAAESCLRHRPKPGDIDEKEFFRKGEIFLK